MRSWNWKNKFFARTNLFKIALYFLIIIFTFPKSVLRNDKSQKKIKETWIYTNHILEWRIILYTQLFVRCDVSWISNVICSFTFDSYVLVSSKCPRIEMHAVHNRSYPGNTGDAAHLEIRPRRRQRVFPVGASSPRLVEISEWLGSIPSAFCAFHVTSRNYIAA